MKQIESKTFPVVIPKNWVQLRKNRNGNHYYIVELPNSTKEVYMPYEWLKLDAKGKFYKGTIEKKRELQGRQRNSIKLLGEQLDGIFPKKDAGLI